ncbi:MAG: permease [Candidatus Eisenbacteria bacterium]|nr:permease [Candidatus Eisenbacteria bacterium]
MGRSFLVFFIEMLKILPCLFVLIGLFEVWVKTETVERHLGHGSGFRSYLWAILLAGGIVGGVHVGLPVAQALYVKRARLGVILAFVSSAAVCRIPMTLFEASFLGWKFTVVRFAVSLPLVVVTSAAIGHWFDKHEYRLPGLEATG